MITNISDVEQMLKELDADWQVMKDSNGIICLNKIATFGDNGYINILKKTLKEKYPQSNINSYSSDGILMHFSWF